MNHILTSISTTSSPEISKDESIALAQPPEEGKENYPLGDSKDILEALKSNPDLDLLTKALKWLNSYTGRKSESNIQKPNPKNAQIIFTLVNDILPVYWHILNSKEQPSCTKQRFWLVFCLRNVAGINAIISRLRSLVSQLKESQSQADIAAADRSQSIETLLQILENVLDGGEFITSVWNAIRKITEEPSQRSLQWKELLSLVASGKVLSMASEANFAIRESDMTIKKATWIIDGKSYALWLGRNIHYMNMNLQHDDIEGRRLLSHLLSKALNLGYKSGRACPL